MMPFLYVEFATHLAMYNTEALAFLKERVPVGGGPVVCEHAVCGLHHGMCLLYVSMLQVTCTMACADGCVYVACLLHHDVVADFDI